MDYQACIATPIVNLGILCERDVLLEIDFLPLSTPLIAPTTTFAKAVCTALDTYFSDPNQPFKLPVAPQGTAFQQRVWAEIGRIPLGEVINYSELARRTGSGARAVANACGANKLPLIIPCHRVVAVNGLGGFMCGQRNALNIKSWLLTHEGVL
ncbi:MAG: methylated-DNA--[protein]-cysteine S-methyltransferase [Methylophilaceae bacterium]